MKPILFNTEMDRAILDGRKTVTRRVVKQNTDAILLSPARAEHPELSDAHFINKLCLPPYQPGDVLYVRETWQMVSDPEWQRDNKPCSELITNWDSITKIETYNNGHEGKGYYVFKADSLEYSIDDCLNWRPSIHMPKEAARLFLRVTDVRVERLQNTDDASRIAAEGVDIGELCQQCIDNFGYSPCTDTYGKAECCLLDKIRSKFADFWNSTVKKTDLDIYGWNANPWVWVIKFERVNIDE